MIKCKILSYQEQEKYNYGIKDFKSCDEHKSK